MNEVEGIVRQVENGAAFVEIERATGCGRCHEPGGCGGEGMRVACRQIYRLQNDINAAVGDTVVVTSKGGAILRAAFWAYGVPGMMMLVGAWIGGTLLVEAEWAAALGAVAGLALGYALLRWFRLPFSHENPELLDMHLK